MKKINYKEFWETNEKCMALGKDIPRVPVDIFLNGDWICDYMKADCPRYYSDYEYQQEIRKRCSEITEKELGYIIQPEVDFGVIMDSSIYGGTMICRDKATPVLMPVIVEPEEIDALVERMYLVDPLEAGLIPVYLEWRENIIRDYGVKLNAGTSLKGCATMLGQILGISNFLTWIIIFPEQIRKLIDCWYDTSVRYLRALRKATGTVSVARFSIASDVAGMLPPELYEEFIKEKEKKLYEEFAGEPDSKRYYHADYRMIHLLPHLKDIGVNEVNIDPYVDCKEILNIAPDVTIYGQIPPTKTLLYGTKDDIEECIKTNIEQAGYTKNLIVTTAGSINPGTSSESLRTICETVEKFGYIY